MCIILPSPFGLGLGYMYMLNFFAKKSFRTLPKILPICSILLCQSSSFAQSLVPSVIPIDEEFVAMQYLYLDASLGALGPFFNGEVVQPIGETQMGASHFCNKQLYLDAKYLYGKPFREFIDFQRFSKLCDWNQNRYYKSLLTLLSIYTHYIIGMLPTQIDYMGTYYLTVDSLGNVQGNITGRATGMYFGYFIDVLYNGVARTLQNPSISTLNNTFNTITWSFTSKGKYDFKPIEPKPKNTWNIVIPLDENKFGSFTDRGEITQIDKDSANILMSIFAYPGRKDPPDVFPPLPPISDEDIGNEVPSPAYVAQVTNKKELTKTKDKEKMMGMVSGMVDIGWGSTADEISKNTVTGTVSITLNQKDMKLESEIVYIFGDDEGNKEHYKYTGKNTGEWQLKPPEQCLPPSPEPKLPISEIVEEYCGMTIGSFTAESIKVPEPSSILGFLALGTLGAASTLKRKLKPCQSTEKETTKVG
ncbi:MAG: PEP-CTERM sorting domain-containing protein [Dolichospermum sp.]